MVCIICVANTISVNDINCSEFSVYIYYVIRGDGTRGDLYTRLQVRLQFIGGMKNEVVLCGILDYIMHLSIFVFR